VPIDDADDEAVAADGSNDAAIDIARCDDTE